MFINSRVKIVDTTDAKQEKISSARKKQSIISQSISICKIDFSNFKYIYVPTILSVANI